MSNTPTAKNRTSFSMSPEALGLELYESLMKKNKHGRALEIIRLVVLGFNFERQMMMGGGIVVHQTPQSAPSVPQPITPAAQTPRLGANRDQEMTGISTEGPSELGSDLMSMFGSGGISM